MVAKQSKSSKAKSPSGAKTAKSKKSLKTELEVKIPDYWLDDLSNKKINDAEWRCSVTLLVENGTEASVFIDHFNEASLTGLRKDVKTITKLDIIKCAAQNCIENSKHKILTPFSKLCSEIYQIIKVNCQYPIPVTLMAPLIKYFILFEKEKNITQRKEILKMKLEEEAGNEELFSPLKSDKGKDKEKKSKSKSPTKGSNKSDNEPTSKSPSKGSDKNKQKVKDSKKSKKGQTMEKIEKKGTKLCKRGEEWKLIEWIDDAPLDGPQLYIVISTIMNPNLLLELIKLDVPLNAVVELQADKDDVEHLKKLSECISVETTVPMKQNSSWLSVLQDFKRRSSPHLKSKFRTVIGNEQGYYEELKEKINTFWWNLKEIINDLKYYMFFKDIIMYHFQPIFSDTLLEPHEFQRVVYDQISFLLYDLHDITKQHNNYRGEIKILDLHDENVVTLSNMNVYNRLLDSVPHEIITVAYILYSILAQVEEIRDGIIPSGVFFEESDLDMLKGSEIQSVQLLTNSNELAMQEIKSNVSFPEETKSKSKISIPSIPVSKSKLSVNSKTLETLTLVNDSKKSQSSNKTLVSIKTAGEIKSITKSIVYPLVLVHGDKLAINTYYYENIGNYIKEYSDNILKICWQHIINKYFENQENTADFCNLFSKEIYHYTKSKNNILLYYLNMFTLKNMISNTFYNKIASFLKDDLVSQNSVQQSSLKYEDPIDTFIKEQTDEEFIHHTTVICSDFDNSMNKIIEQSDKSTSIDSNFCRPYKGNVIRFDVSTSSVPSNESCITLDKLMSINSERDTLNELELNCVDIKSVNGSDIISEHKIQNKDFNNSLSLLESTNKDSKFPKKKHHSCICNKDIAELKRKNKRSFCKDDRVRTSRKFYTINSDTMKKNILKKLDKSTLVHPSDFIAKPVTNQSGYLESVTNIKNVSKKTDNNLIKSENGLITNEISSILKDLLKLYFIYLLNNKSSDKLNELSLVEVDHKKIEDDKLLTNLKDIIKIDKSTSVDSNYFEHKKTLRNEHNNLISDKHSNSEQTNKSIQGSLSLTESGDNPILSQKRVTIIETSNSILSNSEIKSLSYEEKYVNSKEISGETLKEYFPVKYNCFEDLSSDVMVQNLQDVVSQFNSRDIRYCPVNDQLIIMFYNGLKKGKSVFKECWMSKLITDIGLRDFVEYTMEEEAEWLEAERIKLLQKEMSQEETTVFHLEDSNSTKLTLLAALYPNLAFISHRSLKYEKLMEETHLKEIPDSKKKDLKPKPKSKSKSNSKISKQTDKKSNKTKLKDKSSKQIEKEVSESKKETSKIHKTDRSRSRSKSKLEPEKEFAFQGYDLGLPVRAQFSGFVKQLDFENQCKVTFKLFKRLYGYENVSLEVEECGHTLYYHNCSDKTHIQSFHIVHSSGIVISFTNDYTISTNIYNEGIKEKNPKESSMILPSVPSLNNVKATIDSLKSKIDDIASKNELQNLRTELPKNKFNFVYDYDMKMSLPIGLWIEPVLQSDLSYIRQRYFNRGSLTKLINSEKYRCILQNGIVVKYMKNNCIEVLCPNSTIYTLKEMSWFNDKQENIEEDEQKNITEVESNKKHKIFKKNSVELKGTTELKSTTSKNSRTSQSFKVTHYDVILTSGESLTFKDNTFEENTNLLTYSSTDIFNDNTFLNRADTSKLKHLSDGSLIVDFPDGTRITSFITLDSEELFCDWDQDEYMKWFTNSNDKELILDDGLQSQNSFYSQLTSEVTSSKYYLSEISSLSYNKQKLNICFPSIASTKQIFDIHNEGYVVVNLNYKVEHPNYATIFFNAEDKEITFHLPFNVIVNLSSEGLYTVHLGHDLYVNINKHNILYKKINNLDREIEINLQNMDKHVLCTSTDISGNKITISTKGHISKISNMKKQKHLRCFVINRDCSGYELINSEDVHKHIKKTEDEFGLVEYYNTRNVRNTLTSVLMEYKFREWLLNFDDLPDTKLYNCISTYGDEGWAHPFRTKFTHSQRNFSPEIVVVRLINKLSTKNKVLSYLLNYLTHLKDGITESNFEPNIDDIETEEFDITKLSIDSTFMSNLYAEAKIRYDKENDMCLNDLKETAIQRLLRRTMYEKRKMRRTIIAENNKYALINEIIPPYFQSTFGQLYLLLTQIIDGISTSEDHSNF